MSRYFVQKKSANGELFKASSGYIYNNNLDTWKSEQDAFFIEKVAEGPIREINRIAEILNGEDNAK